MSAIDTAETGEPKRGGESDADEERRASRRDGSTPVAASFAGVLEKRNPWWFVLGASPLLLGASAWLLPLPSLAPLAPHAFTAAAAALALVIGGNPRPLRRPGALTVDADAVRWDGEVLAARTDVIDVAAHDEDRGAVVTLHRRLRPEMSIRVGSHAEAHAIVRALGFESGQRATAFKALPPVYGAGRATFYASALFTVVLPFMAFAATLSSIAAVHRLSPGSAALAILAIFAVLGVGHTLFRTVSTVRVGAEAITVRWLWRTDIIPLGDVVRVEPFSENTREAHHTVVIELVGGDRKYIRMGWPSTRRDKLVEHLRTVLDKYRHRDPAGDTAVLLRAGRDRRTWIDDLRAQGLDREGGMRTAPITRERLWTVLEDAGAEPLPRAAAAVALAHGAPPDQRERLRIAAEATATPGLRIAIERAIDARTDDEAVAEALEALEKPRMRA